MKPWSFCHATDIHVGSPRSFRFAPAWNENWQTARKQIIESRPDLLLVGGDVARDGNLHRYELVAVKDDLDALPFPAHVIAGNMDTGNKHTDVDGPNPARNDVALSIRSEHLEPFASVFGPLWWSFVHKDVRFSAFPDMIAGSRLPEEEAFWEWFDAQRKGPRARHHVWMMHSALFIDDLHEPNWDITKPETYYEWYFGIDEPHRNRLMDGFKATGATLVLSGHVHCRKQHRADGIDFHINPSTAFSQWPKRWPDGNDSLGFMKYDVTDKGIKETFVPLERKSRKKGYGPGGHPLPEARDYSIAWEKSDE
ncbi:MAG: metallophosphoesterase [Phycisphaerae bacterium]|nr:metallophosphoesterase [Phycisphaerae bacterium]